MFRRGRESEALRHFRTYPSSPRGFDPHEASQEELLRYGFPRRPDPDEDPELARLWKQALARPVRFVEAKLAIDEVMSARNPLISAADEFGLARWAGFVQRVGDGAFTHPAKMVFAQFQLPDVPPITINNETIAVAFWVGLDGYGQLSDPQAAKQVLQAGVTAQVSASGFPWFGPWRSISVKWWAWTEWYSERHDGEDENKAVAVRDFPVGPGDTLFVVVCAPEPDFGFVSMLNISRGIGTSVGIPALTDIEAYGKSADWIVEIPRASSRIPLFDPVTFTDATAGSLQDGTFNLSHSIPLGIFGPSLGFGPGEPLVTSTIASPTVGVVEELKTDWS